MRKNQIQKLQAKGRRYDERDDALILKYVNDAERPYDGLKAAAAVLGREYKSVHSRWDRELRGVVTPEQQTLQFEEEVTSGSVPGINGYTFVFEVEDGAAEISQDGASIRGKFRVNLIPGG